MTPYFCPTCNAGHGPLGGQLLCLLLGLQIYCLGSYLGVPMIEPKISRDQKFLNQKIFGPKMYWNKHLLDLKFVLTQNIFYTKFFWIQHFLLPKFFLDPKLFWALHFHGTEVNLGLKFVWPKILDGPWLRLSELILADPFLL